VRSGDVLEIIGTAPEWLYVRLPSGTEGWVMSRFTAPFPFPQG
jgi:SH3-like domain-containing protein